MSKAKPKIKSLYDLEYEGEVPTRQELEDLYQMYVCKDACGFGLALMSDDDLKKYICQAFFFQHHVLGQKRKGRVVNHLHTGLKVARGSVYRWIDQERYPILRPGSKLDD